MEVWDKMWLTPHVRDVCSAWLCRQRPHRLGPSALTSQEGERAPAFQCLTLKITSWSPPTAQPTTHMSAPARNVLAHSCPPKPSMAIWTARPHLDHIRTRHRSPHTNGVIVRWRRPLDAHLTDPTLKPNPLGTE